ncbi:hypothetical protein [Oceanicaulis sp.]|uniref:hypothetical protein n=1 Tax=Oceanicaulis sp. TaxID=1924941 RepID=UPI003D2A8E3A
MLGINFRKLAAYGLGIWISAIFLDSLRFKFAGHETPRHIFETLRDWSGIGLFYPAGPWIIGLAELTAALLVLGVPLVVMLTTRKPGHAALSQSLGGLLAMGVMSGAIVFHLFTPLGIETPTAWTDGQPTEWSPALFIAACITWVAGLMVVVLRGGEALRTLKG